MRVVSMCPHIVKLWGIAGTSINRMTSGSKFSKTHHVIYGAMT